VDTHDDITWGSTSTEKVYNTKTRGLVCQAFEMHARDFPASQNAWAPAFNIGSRWVDDRDSWIMDLDISWSGSPSGRIPGMQDPSNPSNSLDWDINRCNNFALLSHPDGSCFISYCRVDSKSLKYPHLLSDIEWCSALSEKLVSSQSLVAKHGAHIAQNENPILYARHEFVQAWRSFITSIDARLLDWRKRYLLKSQISQKQPHALKASTV
jgi:hypothetical protein